MPNIRFVCYTVFMKTRTYLCIDLKSFYASVECVDLKLDPLSALLVVADPERSEKTICLSVSPAMKKYGVKNRCRVFQIPPGLGYITATPRMKRYIEYSAAIYAVYLKYIAKEDIHVYSIDEAFLDVTDYLPLYSMDAHALAKQIMADILATTHIPATAGIGTNLYLTKVALDITAKHSADNIGYLDEALYQKLLWQHRPLTDFWRIGAQTEKKLNHIGILSMRDLAYASEDLLYRTFGVDAELLIDHAWGREPVTIADIKNYRPKNSSLCSGQVLCHNYSFEECELIIKEMVDELCLEMTEKGLVTSSLSLMIGHAAESGHKPVTGTAALSSHTNSYRQIVPQVLACYKRITDPSVPIRRLSLSCNRLTTEGFEQYDLFTDPAEAERDRRLQQATLAIKKKFGKNAIVRGMDLQEAATTLERNRQIGGHKSGE